MSQSLKITADELRAALLYDPETGIFQWRKTKPPVRAGQICSAKNKAGYIVIGFKGCSYQAHRMAWLYMVGDWPRGEIDHIDRDKANNRWTNLRDVPHVTNIHNCQPGRGNRWGVEGVYLDQRKNRWVAEIKAFGKRVYLGEFTSLEEAGSAYQQAKSSRNLSSRA